MPFTLLRFCLSLTAIYLLATPAHAVPDACQTDQDYENAVYESRQHTWELIKKHHCHNEDVSRLCQALYALWRHQSDEWHNAYCLKVLCMINTGQASDGDLEYYANECMEEESEPIVIL